MVAEFQTLDRCRSSLAESRVAACCPQGRRQAHYDLGAAAGLNASYIASIEGRLLAGFRPASRAYDEHEKVLRLDPSRKDAGLTVGTYRYIVSTLSLPLRLMAYVAGFGGGRERGIQMLKETAAAGGEKPDRCHVRARARLQPREALRRGPAGAAGTAQAASP